MASAAIPKHIVGPIPMGNSTPWGVIPIRSYHNAEHIVSFIRSIIRRSDPSVKKKKKKNSLRRGTAYIWSARAISEIPELSSHAPRTASQILKHPRPSSAEGPAVFFCVSSIIIRGPVPKRTPPFRSQATSRGFLTLDASEHANSVEDAVEKLLLHLLSEEESQIKPRWVGT